MKFFNVLEMVMLLSSIKCTKLKLYTNEIAGAFSHDEGNLIILIKMFRLI